MARQGPKHIRRGRGAWRLTLPAVTPPPPPPPTGSAKVPFTLYYGRTLGESGATLVQPYGQKVLRAAQGDFPAGTSPTIFAGEVALPTQVGLGTTTWPDGSHRCIQLMATLPESFSTFGLAGDRHSYTARAVAGGGASTPWITPLAWALANEVQMIFRTNFANLADNTSNYVLSLRQVLNDGIVEGVGTGGTGYPLSSYRVDGNGAVVLRLKARGYLRRISDEVPHTQIVGELYITALASGGFKLTPRIGFPAGIETRARNPQQTVGPILFSDVRDVPGIWEIWHNGVKTHVFGGPTDWRAVTLPAGAVNTTVNQIKFTNTGGDANRPRTGVGYVFESTGTLPPGLQAHTAYYPAPTVPSAAAYARLYHQRGFLSGPPGGAASRVQVWSAGLVVTGLYVNNLFYATTTDSVVPTDPQIAHLWFTVKAGTTGATRPVISGSNEIVDGTVTWMPVAAVMTGQGTGTITAWPVVTVCSANWQVGADPVSGQELWIGPGASPELEVIDDLVYLMDNAKAFPPYDTNISPIYPDYVRADQDGYSLGEPTSPADLNDRGDNPGDMRIGWLNYLNSLALLGQDQPRIQRVCRYEALGWQDRPSVFEDPRGFMQPAALTGLNNSPGVAFPGMGPLVPDLVLTWGGAFVGGLGLPIGPGKYGSLYPPRNAFPLECSHLPACWIIPYHHSGNAMWIDAGVELANGAHISMVSDSVINASLASWARSGQRCMTLITGGRKYAANQLLFGQLRSQAWSTRALFACDAVLPTGHPLRAYFSTMITDATDCYFAAKDWMAANIPDADFGLSVRPIFGAFAQQIWEMSYRFLAICHEGGQDIHPRMREVAEDAGRFMFALFDDANGGNSGLGGYNHVRTMVATIVPPAGTVITLNGVGGYAGPYPPVITYTTPTPAPATLVAFAQSLVAFINTQATWAAMGYTARWDEGGMFLINAPSAFFNPARHDGDCIIVSTPGTYISNTGRNGFATYRPNEVGRLRAFFPSMGARIEWNLGHGWTQGNSTTQAMDGTDSIFQSPNWWVYGSNSYYVAARGAMSMAAQGGIRNVNPGGSSAATIARRFNDRFRTTTNGPPKFTGGVAQSFWHGAATFANFAIRDFVDQRAHPGG